MGLVIYGSLVGAVYGLWAVSFSIIYRSSRVFHVLHAAVFTVAAYGCWVTLGVTGSLPLGIVVGISAAIVLGLLSERAIYQPLTKSNMRPGLLFVASLAAYVAIENIIQLIWRADTRSIELPLFLEARIRFAGVGVSVLELSESVIAILLWILTLILFRFSLLGKAIRAVSTAPDMAELAGIRVERIRAVAFVYGSLLIGIAGILFLAKVGIEPASGMPVWIVAVIASLIGGSHPVWSYVAGFGIALCESVMLLWLPATWQPTIPVAVLIGYLLFLSVKRYLASAVARRHAREAIQRA